MDRIEVFISYSGDDEVLATRVAETVRDLGWTLFIASAAIKPGTSFIEEINRALEQASYLLLLLSKTSAESFWVRLEYEAALVQGAERGMVLLPLLLDTTPVPPLLKSLVNIDLSSDANAGLATLRDFLRREFSPIRTEQTAGDGLPEITRRELRLVALHSLDASDFEHFLGEAGFGGGNVGWSSHAERVNHFLLSATEAEVEYLHRWMLTEPRLHNRIVDHLETLRSAS